MADSNNKALLLQICGMVAMFVSIFLCYLGPIFLFSRRNRRLQSDDFSTEEDLQMPHHWSNVNLSNQLKKYKLKRLLSSCNCISAGVFLGVCFLNLIPCVEEEFAKLIKDFPSLQKYFGSFPLGQFTVICGLFLVLIAESLLSSCFKSKDTHSHSHSQNSLTVPILYLDEESANEPRNDLIDDQEELLLSDEHREEQTSKDKKERGNGTSGPKNGLHDRVAVSSETPESMFTDNHQHHHGHHGHSHMTADIFQDRPDSMFSFFIVFFATSIHSLLEGLALGLQSDISTAIHLFIGIILHECLVSIALGLNAVRLQQQNINLLMHIKFALLFSLTIPLGNVLGILLGYTPGHFGRFISAIFQGFAAGTFIHVTFLELIPEELLSSDCDIQEDEIIKMMSSNQENSERRVSSPIESSETSDSAHSTQVGPSASSNPEHSEVPTNQRLENTNSKHSHNIKLRKIFLLLIGFIIMALVPFIFGE